MKKIIILSSSLLLVLLTISCINKPETKVTKPVSIVNSATFRRAFNFIIVSDWGWNGYNYQQTVADQMAKTADSVDAKFVASCGDNFQVSGVASTQDPLWMFSFENIYKPLSLQVEWFPVLGNHDYKGNTQAEIDYSKISRRWRMTDHYYTFSRKINDSVSARFIFIDTPPFVEQYRKHPEQYPDILKQDTTKELNWLKEVLSKSKDKWILVFGHHPVFSASSKHGDTKEMIKHLKPIFEKYHVQFYFCGHDHDLQHLREKGSNVDYIVNGAGGEPRPSSTNEKSVFSGSEPAFSVVSIKSDSLTVCFVGNNGKIIYRFSRGK
jgi:tartrate-resistant acid phosphatase type 5